MKITLNEAKKELTHHLCNYRTYNNEELIIDDYIMECVRLVLLELEKQDKLKKSVNEWLKEQKEDIED